MKSARELAEEIGGIVQNCINMAENQENRDVYLTQAESHILADRAEVRREVVEGFVPIFYWLLGYGEFPEKQIGAGEYYWRKKLRKDLEDMDKGIFDAIAEGGKE